MFGENRQNLRKGKFSFWLSKLSSSFSKWTTKKWYWFKVYLMKDFFLSSTKLDKKPKVERVCAENKFFKARVRARHAATTEILSALQFCLKAFGGKITFIWAFCITFGCFFLTLENFEFHRTIFNFRGKKAILRSCYIMLIILIKLCNKFSEDTWDPIFFFVTIDILLMVHSFLEKQEG